MSGTAGDNRVVYLDCSKAAPCTNIKFDNFNVLPGRSDAPEIQYVCNNVVMGGNDGLSVCHPSNSTLEDDGYLTKGI